MSFGSKSTLLTLQKGRFWWLLRFGVSNHLLETFNHGFQVYRTSRVVLALISSEEAPT